MNRYEMAAQSAVDALWWQGPVDALEAEAVIRRELERLLTLPHRVLDRAAALAAQGLDELPGGGYATGDPAADQAAQDARRQLAAQVVLGGLRTAVAADRRPAAATTPGLLRAMAEADPVAAPQPSIAIDLRAKFARIDDERARRAALEDFHIRVLAAYRRVPITPAGPGVYTLTGPNADLARELENEARWFVHGWLAGRAFGSQ